MNLPPIAVAALDREYGNWSRDGRHVVVYNTINQVLPVETILSKWLPAVGLDEREEALTDHSTPMSVDVVTRSAIPVQRAKTDDSHGRRPRAEDSVVYIAPGSCQPGDVIASFAVEPESPESFATALVKAFSFVNPSRDYSAASIESSMTPVKDPTFRFNADTHDANALARLAILEICLKGGHLAVTPTHVLAGCLGIHLSDEQADAPVTPYLREERWRLSRILALQPMVIQTDRLDLIATHAYMRADAAALWHHLVSTNFDVTAIAGFVSELSVEASSPSLANAGFTPHTGAQDDPPPSSAEPSADERAGARTALRALVGLTETKELVARIAAVEAANAHRTQRGLKPVGGSMHYVFTGSPGTGKTTVARLMGAILSDVGALSRGHLVEVSRADLIGRYLGETAGKTRAALESARGGVFFVDEAYSLIADADDDMYGREAIVEIIRFMESNRDDLAIVLAGYDDEVRAFLELNPGLQSRFSTFVPFPD